MTPTPADYQHFQEHGGIADLSARAKFRLTGADRLRYLNGQVTANVTTLGPGAALPACVTTAKGKLCADVCIAAVQEDALFVDAEPELRESLYARLERYIIADDAALEDIGDEFALIHLLGLDPRVVGIGGGAIQASRFGQAGWDFWCDQRIWADLRANLPDPRLLLDPELLEIIRVEAGVPRWGRELGEDTLPPEAGLDRTHIDYHKGCYIGQETISRIKSVGHVNRELTGFVGLSQEELLAHGMRLFAAGAPEKPLGQLTSAVWSFALAKPIALGYLKRGSPSEGLLARPAHNDEPALEIVACALPFLSP